MFLLTQEGSSWLSLSLVLSAEEQERACFGLLLIKRSYCFHGALRRELPHILFQIQSVPLGRASEFFYS